MEDKKPLTWDDWEKLVLSFGVRLDAIFYIVYLSDWADYNNIRL